MKRFRNFKQLVIAGSLCTSTLLLGGEVGIAGWYGDTLNGKETTSGEIFDMNDYTVSHRGHPIGTMLKVTNMQNGKSVNVRVNDQDPRDQELLLNLSQKAAQRIDFIALHVAPVRVEVLKVNTPKPSSEAEFNLDPYPMETRLEGTNRSVEKLTQVSQKTYQTSDSLNPVTANLGSAGGIKVQIGSFTERENAQIFIDTYSAQEHTPMQIVEGYTNNLGQNIYKVVLLCDSAELAQQIISSQKYTGAYILRS